MKILAIGDTHWKDKLSYSDYISDGRVGEKKEILDFIVRQSEDCEHVVFMGDFFHSKNNSSSTNRDAVELLERFGEKDVYIISGNHSKKGDGSTAIDFLKEVKGKNWHIITKADIYEVGKLDVAFLPYMLNMELDAETSEEAAKQIMKILNPADILFAHHAISGTMLKGMKTEMLTEVVLPKEELEKRYKLVIAGHIHDPKQYGNTIITGSLFTQEVGEREKFIWKIGDDFKVEKIQVPGRQIIKLENPSQEQLLELPRSSIVKAVVTDKNTDIEVLEKELERFDAHLLVEDYPDERKKMHIEEGAFDFSIEALLKLYAEEKDVDYQKLVNGLSIING